MLDKSMLSKEAPGKLKITVIKATLTRDTKFFTKKVTFGKTTRAVKKVVTMDPFAEIKLGEELKYTTKSKKGAGR